jgi:hypothetical protein
MKPVEKQAYTVTEFCRAFEISKAMFYKLRKEGIGPEIIKIGRSTRITLEAIDLWKKKMTKQ